MDEGFSRLDLTVVSHEATSEDQVKFSRDGEAENRIELVSLLDRLNARLSTEGLMRPKSVESHVPEQAWEPTSTDSEASDSAKTKGAIKLKRRTKKSDASASAFVSIPFHPRNRRPLHLLSRPTPIKVLAEPDDALEGRPRQFTIGRHVYCLTHILGIERIAGEWWRRVPPHARLLRSRVRKRRTLLDLPRAAAVQGDRRRNVHDVIDMVSSRPIRVSVAGELACRLRE